MSIGFWQIAIVVVLVVLLFGRGKISSLKVLKASKKVCQIIQTKLVHHQQKIHQTKIKTPRKNSYKCLKSDGLKY